TDSHLRLVAGATSGLVNCLLTQPLDLLKTRLQQETNPKGSVLVQLPRAYREVIKTYGVLGLWRGSLPSVMRTVPGAAMYFTLLGKFRAQFPSLNQNGSKDLGDKGLMSAIPANEANVLSGATARGILALTFMPITVIKSRYESSLYQYTSLWHASRSIYR
ncbi:mitochondrial carrier domain-containing protein, partial [Piptocephalis cylindrospora]